MIKKLVVTRLVKEEIILPLDAFQEVGYNELQGVSMSGLEKELSECGVNLPSKFNIVDFRLFENLTMVEMLEEDGINTNNLKEIKLTFEFETLNSVTLIFHNEEVELNQGKFLDYLIHLTERICILDKVTIELVNNLVDPSIIDLHLNNSLDVTVLVNDEYLSIFDTKFMSTVIF